MIVDMEVEFGRWWKMKMKKVEGKKFYFILFMRMKKVIEKKRIIKQNRMKKIVGRRNKEKREGRKMKRFFGKKMNKD